jgi:hypothetical protein
MATIPLSLSEQLMYSTVRIECILNTGHRSTGTGFFFRFLEEGDRFVPSIVTNKHVVKDSVQGQFLLTLSDSENNPINTEHIPVRFNNSLWIYHPDPEVDLCIMPIGPVIQQAESMGKRPFYITLSKDLIPNHKILSELRAIEDIIMIGYPNGLWDRINNLPIIRRGVTATHPNLNYNGKEEIMIDAACYPGSSGSPVLIFNEGMFSTRTGGVVGSRAILLGILYAGPQFTSTGEIIMMNIPARPISISKIPMNLGLVIKSHRLLDFEELLLKIINK